MPAIDIYSLSVQNLEGQPVSLESYRNHVTLIVNVASECGYTPQYTGLQALHDKYKSRGLVVVGIPANNFGGQEPGTDEDIKTFWSCHGV